MIRTHHTRRPAEAGFTLIELMVAVALSGIVIGFVFQIHNQMVGALRGQANLSEVVETVTAAREMITRETRLAGMGFPPNGLQFGPTDGTDVWRGVDGTNDVDGGGTDVVDQLAIQRVDGDFYEMSAQLNAPSWFFAVPGADTLGFNTTDPIFLAKADNTSGCAPVPTIVDATGISIADTSSNLGELCDAVLSGPVAVKVARIRRISFRLDPNVARHELGVLQRSINGAAWEDIGVGFTNLQIAIRYWEKALGADDTVDDADGDGDPGLDWYSGDNMEPGGHWAAGRPAQVGISIEGRNLRRLDNLASTTTPGYIDLAHPDNNPLGNFGQDCAGAQYNPCGVLDLGAMGLPPRYQFVEHVYRSSSTTVWLRSRLESL